MTDTCPPVVVSLSPGWSRTPLRYRYPYSSSGPDSVMLFHVCIRGACAGLSTEKTVDVNTGDAPVASYANSTRHHVLMGLAVPVSLSQLIAAAARSSGCSRVPMFPAAVSCTARLSPAPANRDTSRTSLMPNPAD